MARCSRLDYKGALHHVMARGIEQREIFHCDGDKNAFLDRLGEVVETTGASVYAWTLMPNHVHLLYRTGEVPIGRCMMSILGGHATYFNTKYERSGHLFQNRFKSILVDDQTYFLAVLRYVHLNPVRSGLVSLSELSDYRWTGHSSLMGLRVRWWQDNDFVLSLFGEDPREARTRLAEFLLQCDEDSDVDLMESGKLLANTRDRTMADRPSSGGSHVPPVRILGSRDFAERTLAKAASPILQLPAGVSGDREDRERFRDLAGRLADALEVEVAAVLAGARTRRCSRARSILCFLAFGRLGMSLTRIAQELRLSVSAISQAKLRGESLIRDDLPLNRLVQRVADHDPEGQ